MGSNNADYVEAARLSGITNMTVVFCINGNRCGVGTTHPNVSADPATGLPAPDPSNNPALAPSNNRIKTSDLGQGNYLYDAAGRVVAEYSNQRATGGTRYLTQDHLGSTRVVTDAHGNAHSNDGAGGSRHDYFPCGRCG